MASESSNQYQMHKRRELMADNRRYIIYYTFGDNRDAAQVEAKTEKDAPVAKTVNSDSETEDNRTMQSDEQQK